MTTNDPAIDAARTFIQQLQAGQFQAAATGFDPTMSAAMPVEGLQAGWEQVQAQAGAFQEALGAEVAAQDGYKVVLVKLKFANANVACRLVYDGAGKVAGMGFQPA